MAQKLLETLQARKVEGGNSYPVTLDELKQLTDPTVKTALFKQALAQDVFGIQVLRPVPGRNDAPVALAGDRESDGAEGGCEPEHHEEGGTFAASRSRHRFVRG